MLKGRARDRHLSPVPPTLQAVSSELSNMQSPQAETDLEQLDSESLSQIRLN